MRVPNERCPVPPPGDREFFLFLEVSFHFRLY